jgi:pyruvate formate lyase activating enzyme
VSGFYPTYKMLDRPSTPVATLNRAREIGLAEGLRFVYTGNVADSGGEDTRCPGCSTLLIHRSGFSSQPLALHEGRCTNCQLPIFGVWR